MPKGQTISEITKNLITTRVEKGERVDELAQEFNLYPNTIRRWLSQNGVKTSGVNQRKPMSESLIISRLKREKQDLLTIIGELTVMNNQVLKKKR